MIDVASATGRKGDVCFNSVDEDFFAGREKHYTFDPPDMICPEIEGNEGASPSIKEFFSKSCLEKTSQKDGACRHKGCEEGNRQRAKVGLPPISKGQYPRPGESKAKRANAICQVCGMRSYISTGETACNSCLDAKRLETETDRHAVIALRKSANRRKFARECMAREKKRWGAA